MLQAAHRDGQHRGRCSRGPSSPLGALRAVLAMLRCMQDCPAPLQSHHGDSAIPSVVTEGSGSNIGPDNIKEK